MSEKSKEKNGDILKNTVVLVVITLVCVAILAVVYQITKEPIEQAEIAARAEIYKTVYANAENFEQLDGSDKLIEDSAALLESEGLGGCTVDDMLLVTDSAGDTDGYVISATSPNGYGGDIQIAIGITVDGTLTGFDVISNSETAGLGSKCTDEDFKSQFVGKTAEQMEYTKSGATQDNQIDAISGATITTNAVIEAVNSAIVFYRQNLADTKGE